MSETHHSDRLRNECQRCGSSMRHVGKSAPVQNGYHATMFYCPGCDREVLRG